MSKGAAIAVAFIIMVVPALAEEINPNDPNVLLLRLRETEAQRDAALLDSAQQRVMVSVLQKWVGKREADWALYAKSLYATEPVGAKP